MYIYQPQADSMIKFLRLPDPLHLCRSYGSTFMGCQTPSMNFTFNLGHSIESPAHPWPKQNGTQQRMYGSKADALII